MEQIRTIREAAGMTQTALAKQLGVKPAAVSFMEMPGRFPDVSRLPAIADALGCSIDALFGRTPQSPLATAPLAGEPRLPEHSLSHEEAERHGV